MRIIIAGGTGFVGQALTQHFLSNVHEITIVGRDKKKIEQVFKKKVSAVTWDEFSDNNKDIILDSDYIINLAGANIAEKRWSQSRKNEILMSRVQTTQLLASSCAKLGKDSPPLFNASAVGIYGLQKENTQQLPKPYDENTEIDFNTAPDFLAKVGRGWEQATQIASNEGVRVVNMRFAPVLGRQGLLKKLILPYKLGLGGPIGSGNQPFPWIALDDLIAAIDFLIKNPQIQGPVNFVAPHCISQKEFSTTLAKTLKVPHFLSTPPFLLHIIFGEMADELLCLGQCASPKVLLNHGFTFKFPTLDVTLNQIFNK